MRELTQKETSPRELTDKETKAVSGGTAGGNAGGNGQVKWSQAGGQHQTNPPFDSGGWRDKN
jgi:hypothetical protein